MHAPLETRPCQARYTSWAHSLPHSPGVTHTHIFFSKGAQELNPSIAHREEKSRSPLHHRSIHQVAHSQKITPKNQPEIKEADVCFVFISRSLVFHVSREPLLSRLTKHQSVHVILATCFQVQKQNRLHKYHSYPPRHSPLTQTRTDLAHTKKKNGDEPLIRIADSQFPSMAYPSSRSLVLPLAPSHFFMLSSSVLFPHVSKGSTSVQNGEQPTGKLVSNPSLLFSKALPSPVSKIQDRCVKKKKVY